jgi:hypothetical protein
MNRRVTRIDELARDLPPPRDLWPAIQQGITAASAGEVTAAATTRRRAAWMPAVGLAAGVALVALGVLIGLNLAPQGVPVASTQQPASDPENISSSIRPAALRDAEYRKQRDQLIVEVQDRLQAMPEAERAKVAASLNTLKRSIQEIEAALGRDPANALLQELLVSSCQEEMRALTAVRDAGRQEI